MKKYLIAFLLVLAASLQAADLQRPVQVFILAGQSNMEGQGVADLEGKDYNQGKGTLNFIMADPAKGPLFKHLKDAKGRWAQREDVWIRYQLEDGPLKAGPLSLGFTPYDGRHHFGPELQFGWVIGDYLTNQVLLIKTAWGGKSLYLDFRPPSSGGQLGPYYTKMIAEVREALASLKHDFPRYDGRGYELAGFVWYQGWNDGCDPVNAVPEYEANLVNLINDVRKEFKVPRLPVVIGELTGPWIKAEGPWAALRKAQADAAAHPDFQGTVRFVKTHDFVRKPEDSPCPGHGHHEFANAETYFLVGNALGEGMKQLLQDGQAQLAPKTSAASLSAIIPLADTARWMPKHGTVSIAPAKQWEDSLATGNGILGALLAGDPVHDTLIVNHCKLWLPLGSREVVPNVGNILPELRRLIGEKGYAAGHQFFLDKAKEQGWGGKLVWTSLPSDYRKLFEPHAKVHRAIYDRISLDLGGNPGERGLSSEALLDLAQREKRLPAALLERMYDAGRYVFLCSAGPDTPPNLFGIWTGTWQPAWSGDYTLDTNLQLDIESAFSGNMAECLAGYFRLLESFVPDFRLNAKKLYGCRGMLSGSRASNTGIHLHWDLGWPGEVWTPGAPWLAHWFYDYYQYTGDRKFLRERAVPWMKDCALFYEDFLQGTEDAGGHFTFRPSFSAENGWADNATQDIAIARELLTHLISACQVLGIEADGVPRWQGLLAKLPPYLINEEGQLKEWSTPGKGENNNHRHLMHLYGAFESQEFSEEADPKLYQAARVALLNRLRFAKETSTHGYMHCGLSAVQLGMPEEAYSRLQIMATGRSMYASLVTSHEPGPRILCDDGNGAIPEILNRMLVQSQPGRLMLLPAIPRALPQGSLAGTRARGQISLNRVHWDMPSGLLEATITSDVTQEIDLVLPPGMVADKLTVNGKSQSIFSQGIRKQGCKLTLPKGKSVVLAAKFHPDGK